VLHFAEDDLFLRRAVLDDAIKSRMLLHRHLGRLAPEFLDKIIGLHESASIAGKAESPPRSGRPTGMVLKEILPYPFLVSGRRRYTYRFEFGQRQV
jgi:hypothetical protein